MMQFLKTAFWVVLVAIIVLFSATNWTDVYIRLWGDLQLRMPLPLVVMISFLAGSLPFWALHKATRWRMRRKLDSAERALAAVLPPFGTPPSAGPTPEPPPTPSQGQS
jgi:uncharacterized integral membrane protein